MINDTSSLKIVFRLLIKYRENIHGPFQVIKIDCSVQCSLNVKIYGILSEKATYYETNYLTFWKRHNCGSAGCQALGVKRDELVGAQKIFRAVELFYVILQWWVHVMRHLRKPIECTTPGANPNVKYGLWVVMVCQYTFIGCNKCTTLVWDVDTRGGYACVGAGGIWRISVFSGQFCYKPNTSLKNKVY